MKEKPFWTNPWLIFPLILGLVIVITIFICIYWLHPVKTVLLVRHAEKAEVPGSDPPLSCEGGLRAQSLIDVAGDAGVAAISTTQFIRTQQTAQPLADHLAIAVNVVNLNPADLQQYAEDVVEQVLTQLPGDVVFIVSHSNTVPLIVAELGAAPIPSIDDTEYDNLYMVTVPRFFGDTKIVRAKYKDPPSCPD